MLYSSSKREKKKPKRHFTLKDKYIPGPEIKQKQ